MKSKIEEKIKNAREATNEMFAAFEEMNERLSERICVIQLPKEGSPKITAAESSAILEKWGSIIRDKMEEQRKWMPKKGEYATTVGLGGEKLIVIFKKWEDSELFFHYAGLNTYGKLTIGTPFGFIRGDIIRPATPSEIALLDSKLAEQGKRFDKEKLELVDIEKPKEKHCDNCSNYPNCGQEHNCFSYEMWEPKPKHKEPIVGEMAIFWDNKAKIVASCKIYDCRLSDGSHRPKGSLSSWNNAILFESPEQFKAFLKS